ncbi:MmcQ/YjbR family DNA-binding protein [Litorimonas sp. WD9-15]|uniref:MmcQ/YjbR family DNA-binding protein n=1 Tax=Litorimonas sp. WD9-15 TaxID=3418716 RepID=UPI003D03EC1C
MDALISQYARSLPGGFMTEQWRGAHVFKVGTPDSFKMFAILRPGDDRLTVKAPTPETYAMLIEVGVARQPCHLKRGNWMELQLGTLESDDVLERLRDSYDTVFPTLPKRVREALEQAPKKG